MWRKTKNHWRKLKKSSGDGAPKLWISGPCRGQMLGGHFGPEKKILPPLPKSPNSPQTPSRPLPSWRTPPLLAFSIKNRSPPLPPPRAEKNKKYRNVHQECVLTFRSFPLQGFESVFCSFQTFWAFGWHVPKGVGVDGVGGVFPFFSFFFVLLRFPLSKNLSMPLFLMGCFLRGAKGDGPKVTEPNLRFPAVSCENLRFPAKLCALEMLEFPGEGANLRNLRFAAKICVLGFLCHLRSVTLSLP